MDKSKTRDAFLGEREEKFEKDINLRRKRRRKPDQAREDEEKKAEATRKRERMRAAEGEKTRAAEGEKTRAAEGERTQSRGRNRWKKGKKKAAGFDDEDTQNINNTRQSRSLAIVQSP
ncbi:hypothetical protein QBC40DRAFT_292778 [Triangularia verruculosa]|uniref:Uncharacterized protein n=1 Tax=Triangularia verruculosa TaxID=2587418 RepID=A0AAN7AYT7_9PEZI|nr:hypothetical protein QBC40DRAFT_292778 [Triangularia verruculosa]